MTTGRINQVTTFRPHSILTTLSSVAFSIRSSSKKVDHNLFRGLTETHNQLSAQLALTHLSAESTNQCHLVPQSHIFQAELFLSVNTNKNHHLQRELLATGTKTQSQWIPNSL